MSWPTLVVAVCLLSAFSATHARAESTAEQYLTGCKAVASAPITGGEIAIPPGEAMKCWGAFDVILTIVHWVDADKKKTLGLCVPLAARRSELVAVFVKYLENNPTKRHEQFLQVALDSLNDAYPCSPSPVRRQ